MNTEACGCLPVIHEDVAKPLQAEVAQSEGNAFMVKAILDIQKSNPLIANFISQFAITAKDPIEVATCAVLVFKLLEAQADANRLEASLK